MSESTEEQKKGLSIDSQITALRQYCKDNNIEEVALYNDAGISARKSYKKRPALLKLLNDCSVGKIDTILFTRLDRWFRNVQGYYEVQAQLDEYKVPWRAIWEDYETETSSGIFKVNIMLSVAQSEADRTSERVKAINRYKRENGDFLGKPPYGYVSENGKLIKDEEKKEAIETLFKVYLKTYNLPTAQKACAEKGLKIERNNLYRLAQNPVYCGEPRGGGSCEPYITKEEHRIILERASQNPRQPKRGNRIYLFSGLIFCGYCGKRMAGQTAKQTRANGEIYHTRKYSCTSAFHKYMSISERVLEEFMIDNLPHEYMSHIKKIKAQNEAIGYGDSEKEKKVLEAKLKRLAILFEEGDIDIESYKEKREAIKKQLAKIRFEPIPIPSPLPSNWQEIYLCLDDEHRQMYWRREIKSITITRENKKHPEVEFL